MDIPMAVTNTKNNLSEPLFVSLKTLAKTVDAHRSTIRRWHRESEIQPVAIGMARNGAIRYRWSEIKPWLGSFEKVR